MLNVNEVRSLEERWKRYKIKKYLKIFSLIFAIIALIAIFILYYLGYFDHFLHTKEQKSKQPIKKEIKDEPSKRKVDNLVNNKTKIKSDTNITKSVSRKNDKKEPTKALSSKVEQNSSKDLIKAKDSDILQLDKEFLSHIYKEENSTNDTNSTNASVNSDTDSNFSNLESEKNTTNKEELEEIDNNKEVEKENKKPKIVISSKKVDNLKYLKDRYDQTGRAFYAVLISKEYYKRGLYLKSLKWATIANNIDNSNEDSWIMFAKNKVKLHKKDEAIKALNAFLKVNSSKKVRVMLNDIETGVFK